MGAPAGFIEAYPDDAIPDWFGYYIPVAANQLPMPFPPDMNTTGATHGSGRDSVYIMSASPPEVADTSAVRTLVTVGAPESSRV